MKGQNSPIQQQIDALLKKGIVFSIVWLAGIGSLISVLLGVKAKRLIAESDGATGMGRVWWCLIVGGMGIAIWLPIIVLSIVNNLHK
jgi:hypothetical protein